MSHNVVGQMKLIWLNNNGNSLPVPDMLEGVSQECKPGYQFYHG